MKWKKKPSLNHDSQNDDLKDLTDFEDMFAPKPLKFAHSL
jgi:hypothetical protein